MSKSQQYFQDMLESHQDLFDAFQIVHDQYIVDPEKYQDSFNELGEEVLRIIRRYENMLCSEAEGSKYAKFSNKTADTFWGFVRAKMPKIDAVGLKTHS